MYTIQSITDMLISFEELTWSLVTELEMVYTNFSYNGSRYQCNNRINIDSQNNANLAKHFLNVAKKHGWSWPLNSCSF